MRKCLLIFSIFYLSCHITAQQGECLVLDMVHHNPGEAYTISAFNDPETLSTYGFNGQVINEFTPPHSAILYDAVSPSVFPRGSKECIWANALATRIDNQIEAVHAQGLKAFYFMDIILFPKTLVEMYKDELCDEQGKIDWSKPKTKELHLIMFQEIFDRFPGIDGFVIRTGENYRQNIPYHQGNELVNNSHKEEAIIKHAELINMLREEVCVKRNKTVIYRTWDYAWNTERGFLHTQPEYYLGVTRQVKPHPNLYFGIKHTAGDYFRTFPFNRTIGLGDHQQIIEVQCQREYEGKGAYVNYIANGVINGFEESKDLTNPSCLNDLKDSELFSGVWTWSRGGGWNGPYVKDEFWCTANAYVLAQWTNNPSLTEKELFMKFARMKGFNEENGERLHQIALLSSRAVLLGRATSLPITQQQLEWTRDNNMRGMHYLQPFFDEAIRNNHIEEVLNEKEESVLLWNQMSAISHQLESDLLGQADAVKASVEYGRYFFTMTSAAFTIMLKGYAAERYNIEANGAEMDTAFDLYNSTWKDWSLFCKENPWSASIYNISELDESVNKYHTNKK